MSGTALLGNPHCWHWGEWEHLCKESPVSVSTAPTGTQLLSGKALFVKKRRRKAALPANFRVFDSASTSGSLKPGKLNLGMTAELMLAREEHKGTL